MRRYEPQPKAEAFQQQVDAEIAENERRFAEMPLDQKRQQFWDMCRDGGCKEADIQAQWDAYLKGE